MSLKNVVGAAIALVACLFTVTTTIVVTSTGATSVLESSLASFDESVGHMLLTVTSVTGTAFGSAAVGDTMYVTYSISGSTLYLSGDSAGYPATSTSGSDPQGPFTQS